MPRGTRGRKKVFEKLEKKLVAVKFSKHEQDEMEYDWKALASNLDRSVPRRSVPTCTRKGLPRSALTPTFSRKSGLSVLTNFSRLQIMAANTDLRIYTWQENVIT